MKLFAIIFSVLFVAAAQARETVIVYSPYSASHAGTAASHAVFRIANEQQNEYTFLLEQKPGAQGVLALKALKENKTKHLAIIHAAFVDNVEKGQIVESDYVPVHSSGDACWAVVSTNGNEKQGLDSLKGTGEIVVGSVGFGNATHLTALQIGDKYDLPVRFIPYRSNYDATVAMVGNQGINFGIERLSVITQFKEKNPKIAILAMSCPSRYTEAPHVATLKEQGIMAPYVFNTVVSHKDMSPELAKKLGAILDRATLTLGAEEIKKISDMRPSIFDNIDASEFNKERLAIVKLLRNRYRAIINNEHGEK
jgi:tripartite-type tricarboxylate transporter receptor subunit TctC